MYALYQQTHSPNINTLLLYLWILAEYSRLMLMPCMLQSFNNKLLFESIILYIYMVSIPGKEIDVAL